MTEVGNSSVRRPNRAVFRNNQHTVGNHLSRQRNARLVSNLRGDAIAGPSARRSMVILITVIAVATFLRRQHHLLLLTMMEMGEPNENQWQLGKIRETIGDKRRSRLRYDWTALSPMLELTKHIKNHQSDCSMPLSDFTYRNRFGLGSDLHIYGQALAYGIDTNRRIRTVGNWTWMDQSECGGIARAMGERSQTSDVLLGSPMLCYFATSELNCPGDVEYSMANPNFDPNSSLSKVNGNLINQSGNHTSAILTAVVESLFTRVTPLVVREAERQLELVFGGKDRIPKDLITVHIRWGDKVASYKTKRGQRMPEMKKVDISDYINAVNQILDQRERRIHLASKSTGRVQLSSTDRTANIYLATEDPEAVKEFREALPAGWNLFVDQFLVDTGEHRTEEYNAIPRMAKELKGKAGLIALGSLLVAMEADDFVLTTKSNWSQLMDELRQAILDPRCGNCTSMIDLRPRS